jgi:ATP-binding cassette subfamily B protein
MLMVMTSISEVLSIGAVIPFLGIISAPENFLTNQKFLFFKNWLQISSAHEMILLLTLIFCAASLLSGFMRVLLLLAQTRFSYAVGADFSIGIYERTLYQPYSVHLKRNSSEIISAISNKANFIVYQTLLPLLTIVSSVFMLAMIFAALVYVNPVVALSTYSGFGLIYFVIIFLTRKKLAQDSKEISSEQNNVVRALQEGLGGIRDVLIDGTQSVYCRVYGIADARLRKAQANIQIVSGSPRFIIESLGMTLIALLAYWLAIDSDEGILHAIPTLGALALGTQRFLPVLQQAFSSWTQMKGAQVSLFDALELMDQPYPKGYAESKKPIPFDKEIRIHNLSYSYQKNTTLILNGADLVISKGERVGIIGKTGSGKSTFLDIFMGLLEPDEGEFSVDGVEINSQNCGSWQRHVAHVPQNIFLADITIAENIAFGIPPHLIDQARVRDAARKAQINSVIESLPKKYDTLVGERGMRLSGGQKQRIGIARALYKHADVIIFDEATSALDEETEQYVMESIEEISKDITILIVAHRISTLKKCTKIVEIKDSKIITSSNGGKNV